MLTHPKKFKLVCSVFAPPSSATSTSCSCVFEETGECIFAIPVLRVVEECKNCANKNKEAL